MSKDDGKFDSIRRSIRVDLVIAVCALLVSSLATAASWWQTRVIQQQLSAQVWPYLSVGEASDGSVFRLNIANDGLGPAVIRNLSAAVDGKPVGSFTAMMHAILGPHISARRPHGEPLRLDAHSLSPGDVIRAGSSIDALTLKSKHFAPLLLAANARVDITMCYCAILPGTCWFKDTNTTADPKPVSACPELKHDVLHAPEPEVLPKEF